MFGPAQTGVRRMSRPDMRICEGCEHFRQKQRGASANQMSPKTMIPPAHSVARMECCWFWTQEGKTAERDTTMAVYTACANGGRDCPVRREAP